MKHEQHGFTHVYNLMDEEQHRANGWVEAGPVEAPLDEQYFAKFGKKPHHKMKPETIKDALKG